MVRPSAMCWGVRSNKRPPEEPRMVAQPSAPPRAPALRLGERRRVSGRRATRHAAATIASGFWTRSQPCWMRLTRALRQRTSRSSPGTPTSSVCPGGDLGVRGEQVQEAARDPRAPWRPRTQRLQHLARRRGGDLASVDVGEPEIPAHGVSSRHRILQRACTGHAARKPRAFSRERAGEAAPLPIDRAGIRPIAVKRTSGWCRRQGWSPTLFNRECGLFAARSSGSCGWSRCSAPGSDGS